jgi:UDP-N-acetylmuramoyl-tripeptide--D-alanyl-D-alanine ligase
MRTKKNMHMLQQNFYNNSNRYLKWIFNNKGKAFFGLDLLFIVIFLIGSLLKQSLLFMTIFYFIIVILYYNNQKKETTKIKFKVTSRVKRLFVTFGILLVVIIYIAYLLGTNGLLLLGLFAALNCFIVYLINVINKPVEKFVYCYYFSKAKKKVSDMPRLNVIGVTGSYGKTSSKNILADILKVKYDTMPTPKNFNTPYGLMITINNHLDKFTEYFIAEMGACEVGQIKELCDFVHPKYGILTRVGVAHLDSFKTEENIQKTKFELIESLPSDGIGILNMDDPKQVSYQIKNNCQIKWIAIENKDADLVASNIKGTYTGMSFDIQFKGEKKKYKLETKLLGSANVYNILAAVMLARLLGMTMDEIIRGVKGIHTIEHRLEMKKLGNLNIIDDAYNSNPVGAKMAVETLGLMPGKKVIVTPGMIELKDQQYQLNFEFGRQIAKVCDTVILVGKNQTKPIYDGLMKENYPHDKINVFDDVFEAFNIVRRMDDNTYVLLENDLPDLFNE